MRLARNRGGQADPEIIAPVSMHFSFRLGSELMGIRVVEVDVDDDTCQPRIEDVEKAITPRTVGLVCSAPGGSFGVVDPVEAFADLAYRKGLWAARRRRLRRVHSSLHARPGSSGRAVRFLAARRVFDDDRWPQARPDADRDWVLSGARTPKCFEAIPTDVTFIHTTSSTKPGSRAASAWAVMKHLGREGYQRSTAHVLELAKTIAAGVTEIPGIDLIVPPFISIVAFTSKTVDLSDVHQLLAEGGWGQSYGVHRDRPYIRLSIHPSRHMEHAQGFVRAFAEATTKARRR